MTEDEINKYETTYKQGIELLKEKKDLEGYIKGYNGYVEELGYNNNIVIEFNNSDDVILIHERGNDNLYSYITDIKFDTKKVIKQIVDEKIKSYRDRIEQIDQKIKEL